MLTETIEYIGLLVGSAVAVATAYYAGRRNTREEKAERRSEVHELLKIKDEMIEALKEDREALRAGLNDQLTVNKELQEKVKRLEEQMRETDRENTRAMQRVLEAIASSGQCINTPICPTHRAPGADLPRGFEGTN